MNIRPVNNEEDYRAALHEIEALMDVAPGSSEEERLDVFATLLQAYEAKHYPVLPPDPIEAILYQMECKGFSFRELEQHQVTALRHQREGYLI